MESVKISAMDKAVTHTASMQIIRDELFLFLCVFLSALKTRERLCNI